MDALLVVLLLPVLPAPVLPAPVLPALPLLPPVWVELPLETVVVWGVPVGVAVDAGAWSGEPLCPVIYHPRSQVA
jgi:hypothetical protein